MSGLKSTITRILISIIFLVNGIVICAPVITNFSTGSILNLLFGIVMVLLGVLGIFQVKKIVCRVLAVIVCIFSVYFMISVLLSGNIFSLSTLVGVANFLTYALLSWLYFSC